MSEFLLYGKINPAVVSRIYMSKGRRLTKPHPYFYRLHKKKYGIFAWRHMDIFGDWWWPPYVEILGSDGGVLLHISCKSNKSARILKKELEEKLDDWVYGSSK